MTHATRRETLNALLAWCRHQGGAMPDQQLLLDAREQCGVLTEQAMAANTTVLVVPRRCWYTRRDAEQSPLVQRFLAAGGTFQTLHGALALGLLQERAQPDSFWAPYWAALPSAASVSPLPANTARDGLLAGSLCAQALAGRRAEIRADFTALQAVLGADLGFDLAAFIAAYATCAGRAFAVDELDDQAVPALVPLLDLYNHRRQPNLSNLSQAGEAIVLQTAEAVDGATELFVSYGEGSDSHYYINYGFVDQAAFAGQARLHLSLPRDQRCFALKAKLMQGVVDWEMMVSADDFEAVAANLAIARWIVFAEPRATLNSADANEERAALRLLEAAAAHSLAAIAHADAGDEALMTRALLRSERRTLLRLQHFCEAAGARLAVASQAAPGNEDSVVGEWLELWWNTLAFP